MSSPEYEVGDVVYLRESASIGALEAVRISGVHSNGSLWTYTIQARYGLPIAPSHFGNRTSMVTGNTLTFTADEFVSYVDALIIMREKLTSQLATVNARLAEQGEGTE